MPVRTVIDRGPKGKRSVAFSLDWPGWSRGEKTAEAALETLEAYRERYRAIADLAGMAPEFDAAGPLEVVDDKIGTPSTDFWAISFAPSSTERDDPMDEARMERGITILRACWAFFDGVAGRVSEEMRKGPRGGGRDRTRIFRHTVRTESEDFAKQVGLKIPEEGALAPDALRSYREDYVAAMRAYNAGDVEKRMKSWSLPFLIRHSAFHTLDHAWEMEDKDLSARGRRLTTTGFVLAAMADLAGTFAATDELICDVRYCRGPKRPDGRQNEGCEWSPAPTRSSTTVADRQIGVLDPVGDAARTHELRRHYLALILGGLRASGDETLRRPPASPKEFGSR